MGVAGAGGAAGGVGAVALPVGGGVVLEGVDAAGVAAGSEASEADIFCEQNYVTSGGRRMKKESD